ncbi:MAG: hypothetical protein EOP09_13045 [Proteobacteria bacterium]|nr:MAG: hypothetical protein EOP09_13045 [Pseudomonadota bacterium]
MSLDRWVRPLAAFENPLEGVLHQMDTHIGGSPANILKFGCPLNNLAQEMAPVDAGFKKRIQAALDEWISETAVFIQQAQDRGILKKHLKAREIAQFIVMSHEGFFGMIKGTGDKELYQSLIKSLGCYFHTLEQR